MKRKHWMNIFMEADGAGGGDNPASGGGEPAGGGEPGGDPKNSEPQAGGLKNVFDTIDSLKDGAGNNDNPVPEPQSTDVPDSYEFKLGEGLEITDDLKQQFTDIAKGCNMTQAQCDALMKMHSDIILGYMREAQEVITKNVEECQKQGLLTKQNGGYAKTALDTLFGSDAMDVLMNTGAINHPAVFSALINIGKLLGEDKGSDGQGAGAPKADNPSVLFDNSKY